MRLNPLLFVAIFVSVTSCNGQATPQGNDQNNIAGINGFAKALIVKELGNNIMLIHQDKKSNYWFGSWEDGLYKYDGKTMLHFTTVSGLPSNRIDDIQEDHAGNLYFATSKGIVKYDGKEFITLQQPDGESEWKLEANDLWFKNGWDSKFVFRYDGISLYKLRLPKIKIGEEYISKNPTHPNPYSVYSIYKDSKGNIWFGTGALGAFRYNGKSFDWIIEKDVVEIYNKPSEGSNGVRSIIEDKDGYFWFNSMFRYKVSNNKKPSGNNSLFYKREKSIGSLDRKQDGNLNEYLSVAKDTNNNLWIATYNKGVYRYDGKDISHFSVKDGSTEINLFSIYKDNAGNIWLGTPETGVYVFNGQSFQRFTP